MASYLITQATGGQSQAVIKHLLAAGAKVHAVVRNPNKTLPPLLQNPAVKIFKGNSDNADEIYEAAKGCKGVFLVTFPIPGLENQQAKGVVSGARKAGVESIVASTTVTTGDRDVWDNEVVKEAGLHGYFTSKAANEDLVKAGGFKTYTFVRPGFIHVDYLAAQNAFNWPGLPTKGELDHDYEEDARMPHTVLDDLGKFAAAALLDPAKFNGEGIELVSENPTVAEAAAILSRVSGREIKARRRTPEEREALRGKLFVQGFHLWANSRDFSDYVKKAKEAEAKYGIKFTRLEDALMADREQVIAGLP